MAKDSDWFSEEIGCDFAADLDRHFDLKQGGPYYKKNEKKPNSKKKEPTSVQIQPFILLDKAFEVNVSNFLQEH